MNETSWYAMMGISKVFLKNFIIGCFSVCLITIATLASLLKASYKENRDDKISHAVEISALSNKSLQINEEKNLALINLLKEALYKQDLTDQELSNLKTKLRKK